jgi:hypothetical protein
VASAPDPFPRPTATIARLAPWLAELSRTLPDLVRSYLPGRGLDPRSRERIILAVTDVNGCRYSAFIHGSWRSFLGGDDIVDYVDDVDGAVIAFARACAEAGRPLDPALVADVVEPGAIGSLRATVAQIELSNLVGNTVDGLVARLTGRRPIEPVAATVEAATVALAAPIALPLLGLAALMRTTVRLAPRMPVVAVPPTTESNLLVPVLAEALTAWLANAAARLVTLSLPLTVVIGVQSGRTGATVRVGRGSVEIANGIAADAWFVVEGHVETLLQHAAGSIVRDLRTVRIRPGS